MDASRIGLLALITFFYATTAFSDGFLEKLGDAVVKTSPVQVGTPGGGLSAGPIKVDGKGNVTFKSPIEILDDSLNQVPGYALLSDPDKKNFQQAVVTTGVIAAVVSDPVVGTVVVKILSGPEAKEETVAVSVSNPAPSGKVWNINAACIAQQEGKLITAYFNLEPLPDVGNISDGDTVNLTAPTCPLFKEKSVTSVTIHKTGGNPLANRKPPQYTYVLIGNAS